ncbi:MAG: NFACT family protein [Clostridia bacterium]|nr:NFACT family protein [Clostridia bacterium]
MAFDGLVTRSVVNELNNTILNCKIDKVHQPNKDDVIFVIRSFNKNLKLILSSNATLSRAHLTNMVYENPEKPFNFCMVLRKHLSGAKITKIEQISNDRIIKFTFENSNELGDRETKVLIVEIMGKYSNIILLTENLTIIDSIKHVDFETSSVREVMPGRKYELPLTDGKKNPFIEQENSNSIIASDITKNYLGISTLFAKEIENNKLNLFDEIVKPISPCILMKNGEFIDFYIYHIHEYAVKDFDSISETIDTYFTNKISQDGLKSKKNELLSIVSSSYTKNEKKLKIVMDKLKTTEDMENLRVYGELLTANLYKITENASEITVFNYYTNEDITIPLDINLSPAGNQKKIFKKYTKLKNTYTACTSQKEEIELELNYLESIFFEIDSAESVDELYDIRLELINSGFIKTTKKAQKIEPSKPIKLIYKDFTIYVGKNNIQNDYLTFDVARKTDIWLHAKNIPGSHTIIKTDNRDVPDDVILYAASFAAKHSKAKNSPKVDIDYTEVKNVKKIPGAKPGMVIYNNFKTVYVEPAL